MEGQIGFLESKSRAGGESIVCEFDRNSKRSFGWLQVFRAKSVRKAVGFRKPILYASPNPPQVLHRFLFAPHADTPTDWWRIRSTIKEGFLPSFLPSSIVDFDKGIVYLVELSLNSKWALKFKTIRRMKIEAGEKKRILRVWSPLSTPTTIS